MMLETLWYKAATLTTDPKERTRFLKFAVVGAIGALVDLLVLNLLVQGFGFAPLMANPISVATAIVSNFFWNRYWSFPESRSRPLLPQFGQYALINLFGWGINQLIFGVTLHSLLPHTGLGEPWDYNIAKAIAIGLVLFWNFGVNRMTTYRGL